jgi:Protein of unknown function (DUF3054)
VLHNASPRLLALSDTVAILLFVTIGLISHRKGLNLEGYARDALPLLGSWFAAAMTFRTYADPRFWRLAATWAAGVSIGVLIRALILGRSLNGKEAAFFCVALVTIAVFVVVLRLVASLTRPSRPAPHSAP